VLARVIRPLTHILSCRWFGLQGRREQSFLVLVGPRRIDAKWLQFPPNMPHGELLASVLTLSFSERNGRLLVPHGLFGWSNARLLVLDLRPGEKTP
jgi:hypothetical protein